MVGVFVLKILFAARLEAVKDPITFVKAGTQLPNHEFIVAGDGSLKKQCEILAYGSNNIELLGWVNAETVGRLMKEADVFCQLDNVDNIWSSSLVAAMKNNKAVICTNTGFTSKYLKDNYHVLLISPQKCSELVSAIERMSNDPELRHRLGENARAYVDENLSIEKIVEEIRCLITSTVKDWTEQQGEIEINGKN
jgi:glycosyltransferase involved in cell wall biosynthesis